MSDSCNCSIDFSAVGDGKQIVRLKFLRKQLLYDIKNYAYIEADVMGEEKQHGQHVLAEIGEEGNVDRVSRILAVVHASIVELLYPWTISRLIHEYMVYRVLADWLSIMNPNAAANWAAKAELTEREITKAKTTHKGIFTRKTHPW